MIRKSVDRAVYHRADRQAHGPAPYMGNTYSTYSAWAPQEPYSMRGDSGEYASERSELLSMLGTAYKITI